MCVDVTGEECRPSESIHIRMNVHGQGTSWIKKKPGKIHIFQQQTLNPKIPTNNE